MAVIKVIDVFLVLQGFNAPGKTIILNYEQVGAFWLIRKVNYQMVIPGVHRFS
jgi:hypothetical protein